MNMTPPLHLDRVNSANEPLRASVFGAGTEMLFNLFLEVIYFFAGPITLVSWAKISEWTVSFRVYL